MALPDLVTRGAETEHPDAVNGFSRKGSIEHWVQRATGSERRCSIEDCVLKTEY
jgi:hypothetical protein